MSFGIPVRNGLALGLTPSTTLASGRIGGRPALLLNFISTTALPSTITFSRGTQATLTDSTGKITYAPNNLLTNSESFEATTWLKGVGYNSAISANSATSPTGATDADTLVADNAGGTGAVILGRAVSVTAGISYVLSFYAKKNTLSWMQLYLLNYTTPANGGAFFDLNSGSVGTVSTGFTATTTSAGNGWYRCAIAFTAGSTVTGEMRVYLASANNSTTVNRNGTDSIYIWGAQLEQVTYQTTPSTYNSTTPKNLLGYTQEFDNAAWTKSNSFVQTNLAVPSNGSTGGIGVTATANSAVSPSGQFDAITFTKSDATTPRYSVINTIATIASTTTYTASAYFKYNGYDTIVSLEYNNTVNWGIGWSAGFTVTASGVTANTPNLCTSTVTPVGNGWYRCTATFTTTTVTTPTNPAILTRITGATGASVLFYGAQLVQGATAGDYQPTYAAAAAVQYAAPDGTLSADKLVEDTATGLHRIFLANTPSAAGIPFVFSMYAKAAERSNLILACGGSGFTAVDANFNLANGTATGGTIVSVGNGWYRCSLAITSAAAASGLLYAYINSAASYTGDGTSGIYVWGAQLSNSASLDPYVYNPGAAPTSAAYYGPRFDYDPVTLAPKGLLIEEQRSNLLLRSEEFDDASWGKDDVTLTVNAVIAPNGTLTADKVIPNTVSTSNHRLRQSQSTSAVSTSMSVYVKAAEYSKFGLREGNVTGAYATFNLATGIVIESGTGGTGFIQSVGNGWYRCSLSFTAGASARVDLIPLPAAYTSGSPLYTYAGDGVSGIFVWGAQLEAGSFATSYIPTVASTVTRSADVASMLGTNFSSWYNQSEGTFSVNYDETNSTGQSQNILVADDGSTNNSLTLVHNGGGSARILLRFGGAFVITDMNATAVGANVVAKWAAAYKAGSYAGSYNVGALTTNAYGNVIAASRLGIGNSNGGGFMNGHIRTLSYYNTRLTNTQLQALTA